MKGVPKTCKFSALGVQYIGHLKAKDRVASEIIG
jgi:hypothetical protein